MENNTTEGLSWVKCSVCNLSSEVLSSLESPNLTIYKTFCKLIGNSFLEGSFICRVCNLNLSSALEASEEVVKAQNCISEELKVFQNKLDLALLQLQVIGDRAQRGTFQNGVKTVTSKLLTLKDTINIALRVSSELSSMDLTINAELASTSESEASQTNGELPVVDPEGPNGPHEVLSEAADADGGTLKPTVKEEPIWEEEQVNETSEAIAGPSRPYEVTNDVEITIGPVFQAKIEPSAEGTFIDTEEVDTVVDTAEAEPIPPAIVKSEPPQLTRVLRGRSVYRPSDNPPQIIPFSALLVVPSSSKTATPIEIDLESQSSQSLLNENGKRGRTKKKPTMVKQTAIGEGKRRRVFERDTSPISNPPPTLSISEITLISGQLYDAVEKADLDTLKALISKEEVLQVIRHSTSVNEDIRSVELEKVSKLIIKCVEFTLFADENKIEKKMEIIRCLTDVNKALLGPLKNKQNSHASYRYSPLVCFNVHADLILLLMDLGADPGLESTATWNNILSYLAHQIRQVPEATKPVYFQKVLKILEKVIEEQTEWHQPGLLRSFMDRQMPPKVFDLLKKLRSNFNAEDSNGHSLLSMMLRYNANYGIGTIKKFVECGASLAWKGQEGESLLHLAVMIGHFDAVKYFLKKNPELGKAQDKAGLSPWDYFLLYRDWEVPIDNCVEIANILLEFGGKFNSSRLLLHKVAENVNYDPNGLNTELLFRLGVSVNHRDDAWNLPIHLACASLEKKCPPNPPSNEVLLEFMKNFRDYQQRARIIQGLEGRQRQLAEGLCTIRTLVNFGALVATENLKGETPGDIVSGLEIPEYVKNIAKFCLGE